MLFLGKALHCIACVALIIIVLLQADKGEGLDGAFGSAGTGAVFGKRGASGFFAKATAAAATIFMLTSFWLGWRVNNASNRPHATVPLEQVPQ